MNGRSLLAVATPRLAKPKACAHCAEQQLTIQRLREAYALLTAAVALSDQRKRPR